MGTELTDAATEVDLADRRQADQPPTAGHRPRLGAAGEPKPVLRGWFHAGAIPLVTAASIVLIVLAGGAGAKWALAIYLACALLLFGNSATYHIGNWSDRTRATLRRIDHSNIYLFVAGTYTPLSVILLNGQSRLTILVLIWGAAVLGVAFSVLWLGAPRWLQAVMYVIMGWAAIWWLPQFWSHGSPAICVLVIAGGVVYSMGALIYARKKPNPSPAWYGFHELFHTFTLIAAACHFTAIALAVARTR